MKNRTVKWCENKIIKVLSKQPIVQSYLGLSSLVLENVRSIEEQHNLDKAIDNLLSKRIICKFKQDEMTTYSLSN